MKICDSHHTVSSDHAGTIFENSQKRELVAREKKSGHEANAIMDLAGTNAHAVANRLRGGVRYS